MSREISEHSTTQDIPSVLNKLQKWGDYPSVGIPVAPTKFLPMKTPLSRGILREWGLPQPPKHSLTVPMLLEEQMGLGRRIGLIIDLCNHSCLYTDDVPESVRYCHVRLVAKELPTREHVRQVALVAREFWESRPDDYIAIHCAYGFNRTGFILTSYLIEMCGFSVEAAMNRFALSRHPGVKHEVFKRELCARYPQKILKQLTLSTPPSNSHPHSPRSGLVFTKLRKRESNGKGGGLLKGNLGRIWQKMGLMRAREGGKNNGKGVEAERKLPGNEKEAAWSGLDSQPSKKTLDALEHLDHLSENESLGATDRQILSSFRFGTDTSDFAWRD